MPNQLNYAQPIESTEFQRPNRVTTLDENLLHPVKQQILFGTNDRDVVEIWMYNPDGTFASHLNLGYSDSALSIATIITQNGPTEVVNIDLKDVGNRMQIQPGRYSMVGNFFRDEIGSEKGYKLYISEISPDRTELRLTTIDKTAEAINDIFSFTSPSVPKLYAKGLLDQAFGKAILADKTQQISGDTIVSFLDIRIPGTVNRINAANLQMVYLAMIDKVLTQTYLDALNNMALDVMNREVQYIELEQYVEKAVNGVIYRLTQSGEIDPRFDLR